MKGIVFTEFLEMVEEQFGYEVVDKISSLSELHDGAAYTAAGNYPHSDMLAMVGKLSDSVELSQKDLIFSFGRYLFKAFACQYDAYIKEFDCCITFLHGIEEVIHREVHKLCPHAHRPSFQCTIDNQGTLIMNYHSYRPLADLAEGLILECIDHFGEDLRLVRESGPTHDAHSARFIILASV